MTNIRKKICGATIFICVIIHVLLGYIIKNYVAIGSNAGYWWGFLLYVLVPLMPFITGLKKLHISFGTAIAVIYVTVCLAVQIATKNSGDVIRLWHPLWVMFLLIPVYEIFSEGNNKIKNKKNKKDDDVIHVDVDVSKKD